MPRIALLVSVAALALTLPVSGASAKVRAKRAAAPDAGLAGWTSQPAGPVIIVVSISDQRLTLYDNGKAVAHTVISTGVDGHRTPRGIFSIIQKDRYHKSNIYSDAPMPYMQRITWSGIALHEGHVTGRPASHGCIRLPQAFAARLWPYTKMGMRVIVSNFDPRPEEFSNPNLLAAAKRPATASAKPLVYAQAAGTVMSDSAPNIPASAPAATDAHEASAEHPLFVVEFAPASDALARSIEERPAPIVASAPPVAAPAPAVETAVASPASGPAPQAVAALPPAEAAPIAVAPEKPATAPIAIPQGAGHVSIFVSKKSGKLYVRRNFQPIFETPVLIRDPATPLGSHLFTAMEIQAEGAAVRWTAVDVHDVPPPPAPRRLRKGEIAPPPSALPAVSSSSEALERVVIPDDVRMALADLILPGTSMIISDQGFGRETTVKGTDFIVLTP